MKGGPVNPAFWLRLVVLPITLHCVGNRLVADDDNALRTRFLTEAPKGWEQLRAVLLHSKGRLSLTVRHTDQFSATRNGHPNDYDLDVRFMLNGPTQRRVESTHEGSIEVGCRNPQQTFHLAGSNRIPGLYRATEVAPVSPQEAWYVQRALADHVWKIDCLIYGPFAIRDNDLADIVRSETFQLESVRALDDPRGAIGVQFHYKPPVDKQLWKVAVTLDPENFWAVQHSRLEYVDQNETILLDNTLQYQPQPVAGTQVRIPSSCALFFGGLRDFNAGIRSRMAYSINDFVMADVPAREFTLAAFGLSGDGTSAVPTGQPKHLALLLINLGIFLLVIGVWYVKRDSKKQQS